MKKIPLLMLFAVASLALQAQDFTENFEHGGSLPEGWTAYSSGSTYKWSVAKYSTFGKYYTGFNGGDTYAMKVDDGKNHKLASSPQLVAHIARRDGS